MIEFAVWKKAWALLDKREKRNAWGVLAVVVLAAISSAAMIASVMPFLSVLAEPARIHEIEILAWAYQAGGFRSDYNFLIGLGLLSFIVIVGANLVQLVRIWVVARYTNMRMHAISMRLLAAYLRQPYEYFLDRHSGSMSTQILSEVEQVVMQFLNPAANVIASFITVLVVVSLLIWVSPIVALSAFALLGGIYGGTFTLSRRVIAREGEIRAEMNKERYRIAGEALGGIKDIKLLGREGAYVHRFKKPSMRMSRTQVIVQFIAQLPQYVMQAVGFGGMILFCLLLIDSESLGSGSALGGILPLLGVFAFAGQRLLPELSRLYHGLTILQYGRAAVDAVYEDLVLIDKGVALPGTPPKPLGLKGELRLDQVTYYYPNSELAGLSNISLSIHAGETIGVVGGTGAGKTTMADLVLGLLRPDTGALIVDGVSITDVNIHSWQQTVGYVPQDIFLTDASVSENIALGISLSEINSAQVEEAARIAKIDQFVQQDLPEGYDTMVGERGVRLSGGQRQRIGIARAMYHDADLIVFDEATSALDNITERDVMSAIDNLPGDKTILLIAHRLSTVQRCDRIIIFDKGRVVGFDSWEGLIASNEGFRKLVEAQRPAATTYSGSVQSVSYDC